MSEAQDFTSISTKLARIAELAKRKPGVGLLTLAHHIDIDWLREAYRRTRKDGAAGVDGQTAAEYAEDLEANLAGLLERAKSGLYRAPPVRRVWIPKPGGRELRPIGVPAFEDKVLQRAVAMVLEAVYEQDFLDCSYGFRPGRSPHQALESLRDQIMAMNGGWILDVDIQKFFDRMDRRHLREFLRHRVRDGVLQRLIGKWLNAGVFEDGCVTYPDAGSPQGGVISPALSNVYLHYVLDLWFERVVKPRMQGQAFLIRFADDFAMGFSQEQDAHRVLEVLPKRFGRFGLTLHPTKTRLVQFRRPHKWITRKGVGPFKGNGTFDLLGFTHYWARSRRGNWVVKRKTSRQRFSRALHAIREWCQTHRHQKVCEQHLTLVKKLRGHYAYFGITGNAKMLGNFLFEVKRIWKKWLSRRSQRSHIDWPRFELLLERYPLPPAVAIHSVYQTAAKR
jgi:RNA-directed DNA polymerase